MDGASGRADPVAVPVQRPPHLVLEARCWCSTELLAPGVTGKIQVGAEPGDSATVIVPTCGVPLAGGTVPNAPEMDPVLVLLLAQEARTIAPATTNTASFAA